METKSITQWALFACDPNTAFHAWLDGDEHGKMLGDGTMKIDPKVGGTFSIWDGAITGTTLAIDKTKRRIEQEWRYAYDDWPKDQPSKLTIEFLPHKDGTKMQMQQSGLPLAYADEVAQGWQDYYWAPMQDYFSRKK